MKRLNVIAKNALKATLTILGYITPRIRSKWVFGSSMGYSNNSKYLFLHIINNNPEINAIWITSSDSVFKLLSSKGLKVYKKHSFRGLFHAYTAKVYCFSSYVGDINAYASSGAVKVNLWHGVGIKKIEFLITEGPLATIFSENTIGNKLSNINHYIKPDIFLSTSSFMSEHFKECFRLSENAVIESVYPRCEILNWSEEKLRLHIELNEPTSVLNLVDKLDCYRQVYIYMPTWRDNQDNFIEASGVDFNLINDLFKKNNFYLLLKLHPATNLSLDGFDEFSNIKILENNIDIYPILPFTDVLITDYSSVYYDYLLMEDKRCILFPFDYSDYVENCRDLIMPYLDSVGINVVYNFADLLNIMRRGNLANNSKEVDLVNKFWSNSRYLTTKDLVEQILCKLENK